MLRKKDFKVYFYLKRSFDSCSSSLQENLTLAKVQTLVFTKIGNHLLTTGCILEIVCCVFPCFCYNDTSGNSYREGVVILEQTPVKIVSAIMGSGKTTGMFRFMRDSFEKDKDRRFLYVSLFLSEVGDGKSGKEVPVKGRIHEELPEMDFKMPKNLGQGKKENIKELLRQSRNISTTHQSFKAFDKECIQLMIDGNYTLIVDEALDCISQYDQLDNDSLELLVGGGWLKVEDDGKLVWSGNDITDKNPYFNIMRLCQTESLYKYKNNVLIWEYPPLLLKGLDDVYVMTYLFEGSIMSSWMKKNDIHYKYVPHHVFGLRPEEDIKQDIRKNLTILKSSALNRYREDSMRKSSVRSIQHMFSAGWYERNVTRNGSKDADSDDTKRIRKILESTITRTGFKSGEIFWTTFNNYNKRLAGKGYRQKPRGGLEPFLAWNTKAKNEYRHHRLCLYTVNIFKSPVEIQYLAERGVEFNIDDYALSEMLQLIWRGCIRQNEPMQVLIFSDRMERLLLEWLEEGKEKLSEV